MARTLALVVLACTLACSDDRPEQLRQQIAELEEQRMPIDVFERMQAEAHASERALEAFEAELAIEAGQLEDLRAEAGALEAALNREIARNEELRASIASTQDALRAAASRKIELEAEIARHQANARNIADQAGVLARELRPEDPDWALTLRLASLREFLERIARAHPHDASLATLSGTELPEDPEDATRVGADLAARVRDRVREVYGLETAHTDSGDPGPGDAQAPRS